MANNCMIKFVCDFLTAILALVFMLGVPMIIVYLWDKIEHEVEKRRE